MYSKKGDFDLTMINELNDQDEDICHVKVIRLNGISDKFIILSTKNIRVQSSGFPNQLQISM